MSIVDQFNPPVNYPSYEPALAAHEKAIPNHLPGCPFCHQSDLLETIEWVHERKDQSEFHGEAVRCNRCDVIAPLPIWMRAASEIGVSQRGPVEARSELRMGGAL